MEWCNTKAGHAARWPNAAFVSSPWPWCAFTNTGSHASTLGMQSASWLMGPKGFLNLGSWGIQSVGFCLCSGFCVLLCKSWASSRPWAWGFYHKNVSLGLALRCHHFLELENVLVPCKWPQKALASVEMTGILTNTNVSIVFLLANQKDPPLHTSLLSPCRLSHLLWCLCCVYHYSNLSLMGLVVLCFLLFFNMCILPCYLRHEVF